MALLVITNYSLIGEGNLGCCQPKSPAADTQQDRVIVPSQFIGALTELTDSIDCPGIIVTLLCLWS